MPKRKNLFKNRGKTGLLLILLLIILFAAYFSLPETSEVKAGIERLEGINLLEFDSILTALTPEKDLDRNFGTSPETVKEIYFCPEEDCEKKLLNQINSAEQSILCAMYDISLPSAKDALIAADENGLNVKIVSDLERSKSSLSVARELKERGLLKLDNRENDFMHNKFCVFDSKIVWVGSMNATERGTKKNNNSAVLIESQFIARNFENEFNEMWQNNFGNNSPQNTVNDGGPILVYFCPEDNCIEKLLLAIENSGSSIKCMFFSFTEDSVSNSLIEMHKAGKDVKVIFETGQISIYSEYQKLYENQVSVLKDRNPYNMHNKFCVFDRQRVMLGSMNASKHANEANDESIVFISDSETAAVFDDYFNSYWKRWSS